MKKSCLKLLMCQNSLNQFRLYLREELIGVTGDRIPGRALVIAVLDNLTKGSSGQAIQNANLMLGLEETAGLMGAPVFP